MSSKPQSKTFGKSTREVPASADKAKKWYNAEDEPQAKDVSCCSPAPVLRDCVCLFGIAEDSKGMAACESGKWGAKRPEGRLRGSLQ